MTWLEPLLVIGGAMLFMFCVALWVINRLEKNRWPRPNVKVEQPINRHRWDRR